MPTSSTHLHTILMRITDVQTGAVRYVTVAYHVDGDRAWGEVEFEDGTTTKKPVDVASVHWWRRALFPPSPGGGVPLAKIVTMTGDVALTSVQETMRRVRQRREDLESIFRRTWDMIAAD